MKRSSQSSFFSPSYPENALSGLPFYVADDCFYVVQLEGVDLLAAIVEPEQGAMHEDFMGQP